MKTYAVTVEVTFSVESASQERAEERAQEVADHIGLDDRFSQHKWYNEDFSIENVDVQEN